MDTPRARWAKAAGVLTGSVWVFHGLYSKLLDGIPRHRMIVGRILGESLSGPATLSIGFLEVGLGLWALTGRKRVACAVIQTLAIVSMNTLEILLAGDLLISGPGMVALNAAFLGVVWFWALAPRFRRAIRSEDSRRPRTGRSGPPKGM